MFSVKLVKAKVFPLPLPKSMIATLPETVRAPVVSLAVLTPVP